MKNKNITYIVFVTVLLLLIPLIAMQFTNEVNWTLFDFVSAGILLLSTGLAYEFISRNAPNAVYKVAMAIAIAGVLMLIWINGAVGIIGSENNQANSLYLVVPVLGVIGSIMARLSPRGMAKTLFITAFAQALVPVIALIIWKSSIIETPNMLEVFMLNGFFVALFTGSGLLFLKASSIKLKDTQ